MNQYNMGKTRINEYTEKIEIHMGGEVLSRNQTVENTEKKDIFNHENKIFVVVAKNQDPVPNAPMIFFSGQSKVKVVDLSKEYNLEDIEPISAVGGYIDLRQQTLGSYSMYLKGYRGTDIIISNGVSDQCTQRLSRS